MKKLVSKFTAFTAVVLIVVTASVYLAKADNKAIAVVMKTIGSVQAKHDAGWASVARAGKLYSGDQVQTKKDGYAAVMFIDDKSLVKIKPNSILKIQGTTEGKSISKQLVMDVGELFVKVSKQKGSFQVATPTSVASVKGTEFWVSESDGSTSVISLEGVIELVNKASGQSVQVTAGQTGISTKGGKLNTEATKEGAIPNAGELTEEIIIKFKDADGNSKEVRIKY